MTRRRPASPAPALPLGDCVLREILLRLPPQPSSLPRASLVCKRWRRLVSDPQFLRRFRAHHREPPLLGVFIGHSGYPIFRSILDPPDLIPPERFFLHRDEGDIYWDLLGCRHGRVLVFNRTQHEVIVWDPATGDRRCVAVPLEFDDKEKIVFNGAVLCADGDEGHVHGDCHSSPFMVVLIGIRRDHKRAFASIYSSETGIWGDLISEDSTAGRYMYDMSTPSTLVGDSLYWLFDGFEDGILEFDLNRQSLAVIEMPPDLRYYSSCSFQIMPAEDGGVELAILSYHKLEMWERKVSCDGVARWVLRKTIKLGSILGLGSMGGGENLIMGYDEDVHEIYIRTKMGVFMVQLESMQFRNLGTDSFTATYHPYRSFCTAVLQNMARRDVHNDREEGQQMQMAMQASLEDLLFRQRMQRGGTFEHSGGSGSGGGPGASTSGSDACSYVGGGGVLLQKSFGKSRHRVQGMDADLVRSRAPTQTQIGMIYNTRSKLGKAWAKWFHSNGIPGRKADCPYFRSAMKLTQQLGTSVLVPTGAEIDGTYLDANEEELKEHMLQFKEEWEIYGVTIMCDSWTGPTMMSIVNFFVNCNNRMFFHKSVNATGKIKNADFLYGEIKQVVEDIGIQNVVQIVTDSGANYKKACHKLIAEYNQIVWQPCAAHTVNLMLKEIAKFPEVAQVVDSAKQICRFFYNHDTLHAEMKTKIGGELVPPNATRSGTVFVFIQSFWNRKDKFCQWMVSKEWRRSTWSTKPEGEYAYDCLTSKPWWDKLKWVINALEPIYCLLRYADQQKDSSISGFMARSISVHYELQERLGNGSSDFNRIMDVINTRLLMLKSDNLMIAAGALDPEGHYKHNLCLDLEYAHKLTQAILKLADSPENAVDALCQVDHFRSRRGIFDSTEARDGARRMTSAAWWMAFGGQFPAIQKLALRIVSQCSSSSGCERNWSTFALVHTQLSNQLGYAKLHKLVYVHYNLRLRRQFEAEKEKEIDTVGFMMDATLFDTQNPLTDWLDASMDESEPLLDEPGDPPMPAKVVVDAINAENSSKAVLDMPLTTRTKKHIGRSHKAKRKCQDGEAKKLGEDFRSLGSKHKRTKVKQCKQPMNQEEDVMGSDDETDAASDNIPYAESGDSSSPSDDEGANDNDNSGGLGGERVVTETEIHLPLQFTCEQNFKMRIMARRRGRTSQAKPSLRARARRRGRE